MPDDALEVLYDEALDNIEETGMGVPELYVGELRYRDGRRTAAFALLTARIAVIIGVLALVMPTFSNSISPFD